MSKPGQKKSLVDINSTSVPGIPLNLQSAPKHTSTAGKSSRRTAQTSTTSCDDDVFGLKSLSSRGSSVSAVSTPAATAVATLVQIGEGSSDDSSVFTDWDRLRSEAAAIAGGIAAGGETPNRMPDLDAFSPLVGDSPLLFSEQAKEPPDNLLVSSPEGSPLKPLRLKDEMDANSASEGASAVADLGGGSTAFLRH